MSDQVGSSGCIDREITVRGLRLFTRRRPGNGIEPPLMMIHGLGGTLDAWQPLLDELPDREIIMIDTPGMGRSEVPSRPLSMRTLADVMAEGIRELGVTKHDLLGFSHGGAVSQELVHRHPDQVRRLILVGTVAGVPWLPPGFKSQRAILSTRRYDSEEAARHDLPLLAGGRTANDPEMLERVLQERKANPPDRTGYRYLQLAILTWSSLPWLHTIKCRALVIQGTDDPMVRTTNGRLLAARLPHARLKVLEGAGHMVLFDESERAARYIREFLDS